MLNRPQIKSSFISEITVDDKYIIYLGDIADQIYRDYADLSASILAHFHDLNLPNIDDMHLSHEVAGYSVNIFKTTASGYANYSITGEILQLQYLRNTGYPFNTIKRVYQ